MSSKLCDDDDFAALFLLMSGRTPLLACLISETRLRDFMSSLEKRLRYRRIPRCALVDTEQVHSIVQPVFSIHSEWQDYCY
jgi:hypothetical protein